MIQIKVSGCKLKDINEFENFQGNLKELPEIQKNKLKESITRNGFNAPIFTWKGNNYILDGHQRIIAVKELIKEGQELKNNELPYIEIEADNKKQAGELILTYNSQYGKIKEESLTKYIEDFELDLGDLENIINIDIKDIDLSEIVQEEEPNEKEYDENIETENKCPKCGYEW